MRLWAPNRPRTRQAAATRGLGKLDQNFASRLTPVNAIGSAPAGSAGGQVMALATAARIWSNHHWARTARLARRRPQVRLGAALNPSSSCWLAFIMVVNSFIYDATMTEEVGQRLSNPRNILKMVSGRETARAEGPARQRIHSSKGSKPCGFAAVAPAGAPAHSHPESGPPDRRPKWRRRPASCSCGPSCRSSS